MRILQYIDIGDVCIKRKIGCEHYCRFVYNFGEVYGYVSSFSLKGNPYVKNQVHFR